MMTGFGVQNQDRPQLLPKPLAKLEQGFLPLAQTSFMANLSDQQREALHR
jgi:hypothetical protein